MGYYIQTPDRVKNKAVAICAAARGTIIGAPPRTFDEIPAGMALIVVVANPLFEAAAFAHSASEFAAFVNDPSDLRPRQFVLVPRWWAEQESGYAAAEERDRAAGRPW